MIGLKIGDLTARVPIIQGGMGVGISLSGLAAAVANEGSRSDFCCRIGLNLSRKSPFVHGFMCGWIA